MQTVFGTPSDRKAMVMPSSLRSEGYDTSNTRREEIVMAHLPRLPGKKSQALLAIVLYRPIDPRSGHRRMVLAISRALALRTIMIQRQLISKDVVALQDIRTNRNPDYSVNYNSARRQKPGDTR